MIFNFVITALCFTIALNIRFFEAKPFEVSGKDFVYVNTQNELGDYNFSYNDEDQLTNRMEMGKIVKSTSGNELLVVNGSYTTAFDLGDCQTIVVKYRADENGFRSQFTYEEKVTKLKVTMCQVYREAEVEPNIAGACISSLAGSCSLG